MGYERYVCCASGLDSDAFLTSWGFERAQRSSRWYSYVGAQCQGPCLITVGPSWSLIMSTSGPYSQNMLTLWLTSVRPQFDHLWTLVLPFDRNETTYRSQFEHCQTIVRPVLGSYIEQHIVHVRLFFEMVALLLSGPISTFGVAYVDPCWTLC